MANNPFDQKNFGLLAALSAEPRRNSLLDYVAPPTSKPEISPMARAIADLLMDKPKLPVSPDAYGSSLASLFGNPAPAAPVRPTFNALANLTTSPPPFFAPPPPPNAFGSQFNLVAPTAPTPFNELYPPPKPKPVVPETKRKVFFSFHFEDIMRVNNVRNAWKITHPNSALSRSFYDSSLWEARKLVAPESIKQLIRSGVLRTSAVCVLAGSLTWDRRWVKYEIARAVIDGRGLLTVHINSINHHQTKGPHPLGLNPLAHMGVAKLQPNKRFPPQYFLYEMKLVLDSDGGLVEQWTRYDDYTLPVKKPAWLDDPPLDHVVPLAANAAEYDYEIDGGDRSIGSWIDKAARQAGR
ncbi:TIR domain-containing protein [Bradyrhizobium sp. URHC0002]